MGNEKDELIQIITEQSKRFPTLRFIQLLHVLDILKSDVSLSSLDLIIDEYYMKDDALLERVRAKVNLLKVLR